MIEVAGFIIILVVALVEAALFRHARREVEKARHEGGLSARERDRYRISLEMAQSSERVWRAAAVNFEQAYRNLLYTQAYNQAASRPTSSLWTAPALRLERTEQHLYQELIDAGRRALAKKYHPDAGGSEETMKAVNAVADKAARSGR